MNAAASPSRAHPSPMYWRGADATPGRARGAGGAAGGPPRGAAPGGGGGGGAGGVGGAPAERFGRGRVGAEERLVRRPPVGRLVQPVDPLVEHDADARLAVAQRDHPDPVAVAEVVVGAEPAGPDVAGR